MTEIATTAPLTDSLAGIAAAQADWVRRHMRVAVACAGGLVLLAAALTAGLFLAPDDAVTPQAVVIDGVLMGLVGSACAAAANHALFAARFRRLAENPPTPTPCRVERLGADTKLRKDHAVVTVEGQAPVLVRAEPGSPMMLLPEGGDAVLLGTLGRRSAVLVGVPGRAFVAARPVGRPPR